MVGNVYSEEKCPVCGGKMRHDERRGGVFCLEHTKVAATGLFVVRFGAKIRRRFRDYEGARRFLWELRGKADKGTVDPRDYASGKPMSIRVSLPEWLKRREAESERKAKRSLRKGTFKSYRPAVSRAVDYFGDRNIKSLTHDDIEGFFYHVLSLGLSEKTAKNNCDALRVFYNWLLKNKVIKHDEVPVWPSFDVDMKQRDVVDLETQQIILDRIKENEDPKVWLACSILARHINVRPGELRLIEEGDIDLRCGTIEVGSDKTKTKTLTTIHLFDDEIEFLSSLPPAFPRLRFFRHSTGTGGVKVGSPMGDKIFNRAWCRAAKTFGVDVTLYPGTKHSTASAVANAEGMEMAKAMTGHRTNAAFERYIRVSRDGELRVQSARDRVLAKVSQIDGTPGTLLGHQKEAPKNRK